MFRFLGNETKTGLKVKEVNTETMTVVLRSMPSLFSWGETIEATVGYSETGSVIIFRGSVLHPWNLTANVQRIIDRVTECIKQEFGETTP